MDFNEVKAKSDRYLFQNYGRIPLSFTHGRGCYLYGSDGRARVLRSILWDTPIRT